jgi:hypothetical protein
MPLNHSSEYEKKAVATSSSPTPSIAAGYTGGVVGDESIDQDFEVFKETKDGVNFRTVGWPRAAVIFLKVQFALGVLGIPTAFASLGKADVFPVLENNEVDQFRRCRWCPVSYWMGSLEHL